ncbi:peptidylprolyl isomerase FKBP-type [Gloeothece citriformis PCC 7424]|uniref:Peptidyl-prolyl cis-trans isomerase n=1 Tax=Gloeothece citriformis (strain PCC 7424) TaxID=65393 RepID=B7K7F3_GLOC7|nr:peptidylprolyl isomerase [Gloeothece citriformis]ACK69721.1 peptidylprolyl isomerase FKBP-type [Gloeothece citriformis PCC 7424]
MAQAKLGDQVKVHYTGKLDNGMVFDSSVDRTPLEFSIGEGNVIPGFEEAVIGMSPGDSKTVTIGSNEAYGPYYEELVMIIDRQQIPSDLELEIGQQLQIRQETGQTIPVVVRELSENDVTLDANHPLAGEDLTFEIELVEIG